MDKNANFDGAKWRGARYIDWCKEDPEDARKINYVVHSWGFGQHFMEQFTSEDSINPVLLVGLRECIIMNLDLINNEWYVTLEL